MLLISLDFWLVGGYVMFCTELICPKRFPMWKLLIIPSSFVIYTLIFLFTGWQTIYWLDIFTSVIMVSVFYIFLELTVKRYTRMLEENISDLENFDLSWIVSVLRLMLIFAIFLGCGKLCSKNILRSQRSRIEFHNRYTVLYLLQSCSIARNTQTDLSEDLCSQNGNSGFIIGKRLPAEQNRLPRQ